MKLSLPPLKIVLAREIEIFTSRNFEGETAQTRTNFTGIPVRENTNDERLPDQITPSREISLLLVHRVSTLRWEQVQPGRGKCSEW